MKEQIFFNAEQGFWCDRGGWIHNPDNASPVYETKDGIRNPPGDATTVVLVPRSGARCMAAGDNPGETLRALTEEGAIAALSRCGEWIYVVSLRCEGIDVPIRMGEAMGQEELQQRIAQCNEAAGREVWLFMGGMAFGQSGGNGMLLVDSANDRVLKMERLEDGRVGLASA